MARQGPARFGGVRFGKAQFSWFGSVGNGVAGLGVVRQGVARLGKEPFVAWSGQERSGLERRGSARQGMELTSINDGQPIRLSGINNDPIHLHALGPTELELALYAYLDEMEIEFVREWPVPGTNYQVDAFDKKTKTAYEADGPMHDQKRDRRRDARILATGEVEKIVRLTYKHLRGWLP